jgi:hypothetical protein
MPNFLFWVMVWALTGWDCLEKKGIFPDLKDCPEFPGEVV